MRLFWYYARHTVTNQLRKLLRSWVAIVVLVVVLLAVAGGILGAVLAEEAPEDTPAIEVTDPALAAQITELSVAGIILLMFTLHVTNAEKSGNRIFLPADVALLFPAPLKPQSVLLFRLMAQLGAILFGSIYLLFQLPNLALRLGMGGLGALVWLLVWLLILIYAKLLQVLLYTVASTHEHLKKFIRPALLSFFVLLGGSFYLFLRRSGLPLPDALFAFFNHPLTRHIPVYGWLKAMAVGALTRSWGVVLWTFPALTAGVLGLIYLIWHLKADFYEEAMAQSAETAALQQAMAEGKMTLPSAVRKKERSDKLRREGFSRGWGASVFFFKTLYNRFRFSRTRYFTKTAYTYLLVSFFCLFSLPFAAFAALVCVLVFFRAFASPLAEDTKCELFLLCPEPAHTKVFFSLLGGTVNCVLDLLPAFLLALLLTASPLPLGLLWLLFAVSLDFYATNTAVFIDLSLPTGISQSVKNFLQILFIYFGITPAVIILGVGFGTGLLPFALMIGLCVNTALGFLFFGISPLFIRYGRK
ncbi:MAG: putative ABC exporter domain-containing protein [Eubacteriales bacterium]